jgi:exodeoxyribonuclease V gamma subunit
MLHLTYSNRFERLVDHLAERLEAQRGGGWSGFLQKVDVVVPTYPVGDWVELALATRDGAAAHLEMRTLEEYLRDLLPDRGPGSEVRIITRNHLETLVLGALEDDELLADADFAPVRAYLEAAEDGRHDEGERRARDVRRYQLAQKVADLFNEYIYSRREMLESWSEGTTLEEPPFADAEVWQRRLWQQCLGDDRTVVVETHDGSELRYMTLPAAFESIPFEALEWPEDGTLHLFGLRYLGPALEPILEEMAETLDVHAYVSSPARGGADAIPPLHPEDGDLPGDADLNPALRLWGRSGRHGLETFESIARRTGGTIERDFEVVDETPRLLEHLQADVLEATPESAERPSLEADESIEFIACRGSVRREIETIANQIWRLKERDDLSFNDFAILLPRADRETYVAQIESVFEEFGRLPRQIVGIPASSENRIVEATKLLLELPFGEFRRSELLRLVIHPNVRGNFPGVSEREWVRWCDNLDIIHGADHEDHEDTYIERDLYNWDQGMSRLALGCFMSGEQSGVETIYEHEGEGYLPEDVRPTNMDSAGQLNALARSLIEDAQWLTGERKTLAEWGPLLAELLDTYLCPSGEYTDGYQQQLQRLHRCKYVVRRLATFDIAREPVSYRTACAFALDAIEQLNQFTGDNFVEGVVVSGMETLRSIPFEHVFVPGLGEEQFPSQDPEDRLDLRRADPRGGDVSPSELDKFAYLEAMTAARSGLHLSWISRDGATGDDLEPSSIVHQTRYLLELFDVPARPSEDDSTPACTFQHPVHRYDRTCGYFPEAIEVDDESTDELPRLVHPDAFREAQIRAIHEHLAEFCRSEGIPLPNLRRFREFALEPNRGDPRYERLVDLLQLPQLSTLEHLDEMSEGQGPGVHTQERRHTRVSLSKLRKFLETPLQTAAEVQFQLRQNHDDPMTVDNEPFEVDTLRETLFLRRVFENALLEPLAEADIDELYDELLLPHAELRGESPTGIFGDYEREEHKALLEQWISNVEHVRDKIDLDFPDDREATFVGFGDRRRLPAETDEGVEMKEPIRVEVERTGPDGREETVVVDIHGRVEPLSADERTFLTAVTSDKAKAHYFLRGYVSHLALAAAETVESSGERTILLDPARSLGGRTRETTVEQFQKRLPPIRPDEAREHLTFLVQRLLGEPCNYLLPVDVAATYWEQRVQQGNELSFSRLLTDRLRGEYNNPKCCYGPIQTPTRYPAHPDPDDEIRARFRYHPDFDAS